MARTSLATLLKMSGAVMVFCVLLFAGGAWESSTGFIGSDLREIMAALRNSQTQSLAFLCFGMYFAGFLLLQFRAGTACYAVRRRLSGPHDPPAIWLSCALLISAIIYAFNYSPSVEALALLAGAVLGQGVATWTCFETKNRRSEVASSFEGFVTSLLVILLVFGAIWHSYDIRIFKYHTQARWSGPWDNPNIAGLLMGTGVMLAGGSAVLSVKCQVSSVRTISLRYVKCALFLLAAALIARGLSRSYSRGAWLGTICGLGYLACCAARNLGAEVQGSSCSSYISWFRFNWKSLFMILFSLVVLTFWRFRQTDWHLANRAYSAVNTIDFSWRNRVAAWEGALQITAEHPWFGASWNQPEQLYAQYYIPPKVSEIAAFELNDYLILGATLGIPALFCFAMYLWLSLFKTGVGRGARGERSTEPSTTNSQPSTCEVDWLKMTCRAGAIVLLVGFWFDGGLFKLATASTFWILLELGSTDFVQ